MDEKNLFTDEELSRMGQRTLDLLLSSIDNAEPDAARNLSRRMYAEFSAMHDLYRDWITHLLTFLGERYGDDILHEALKETVGAYTERLGKRYADKDTKRKMEMLAAGLRGHLQAFEIREESDRFVIIATTCGSGGRLIREGAYDPPCGFHKIQKPQAMTFHRPDFPVYCAHCYFQNLSPAGPDGEPLFITEPAEDLGHGPCRITIAKKEG